MPMEAQNLLIWFPHRAGIFTVLTFSVKLCIRNISYWEEAGDCRESCLSLDSG